LADDDNDDNGDDMAGTKDISTIFSKSFSFGVGEVADTEEISRGTSALPLLQSSSAAAPAASITAAAEPLFIETSERGDLGERGRE